MKKLFLDLEGTLIDDIDNCNIIARSLAKVKAFIKAWQPDEIETFSWAFWDASDLAKWNSIAAWLKKELEREVKFQSFDVREQRMAFLKSIIGHVKPGEEFNFGTLANKERVFEWFIKGAFNEGVFALIDDTVTEKIILFNKGRLVIEFFSANGELKKNGKKNRR